MPHGVTSRLSLYHLLCAGRQAGLTATVPVGGRSVCRVVKNDYRTA